MSGKARAAVLTLCLVVAFAWGMGAFAAAHTLHEHHAISFSLNPSPPSQPSPGPQSSPAQVATAERVGTCYNSHGDSGDDLDVELPSMIVSCTAPHDLEMASVATQPPSSVSTPLDPSDAAISSWENTVCNDSTVQKFVAPTIATPVPLLFTWTSFYEEATASTGPQVWCLVYLQPIRDTATETSVPWSTDAHGLVTAANVRHYMYCEDTDYNSVDCDSSAADSIEAAEWYMPAKGKLPSDAAFDQIANEHCPSLIAPWTSSAVFDDTWPGPDEWSSDIDDGVPATIECWIPLAGVHVPTGSPAPNAVG